MYMVFYIQKIFFILVNEFNSLGENQHITQEIKFSPGFNSETAQTELKIWIAGHRGYVAFHFAAMETELVRQG